MQIHLFLCMFAFMQPQSGSHALKPPTFGSAATPRVQVQTTEPMAPVLTPPKGYRQVQVPEYIADTYMRFASTETAHDYEIADVKNRVSNLEQFREKNDRPDIDSLKETRTKALIYLTIATTAVSLVWGLLAALLGFLFKAYIAPRLRTIWELLGSRERYPSYAADHGITLAATEDEDRTAD